MVTLSPGVSSASSVSCIRTAVCADEIIAITSGKTKAGEEAFKGYNHRWMEASFAWGGNLAAGYTDAEVATSP